MRMELALVLSEDGGETFGAPVTVPRGGEEAAGFNGSRQGMLTDKFDVAENGEVVVVNSTFDEGRSSHVWLMRGRPIRESLLRFRNGEKKAAEAIRARGVSSPTGSVYCGASRAFQFPTVSRTGHL